MKKKKNRIELGVGIDRTSFNEGTEAINKISNTRSKYSAAIAI